MCEIDRDKIETISLKLRASTADGGLTIKDRYYHLKKYHSCFVGSEAIDWFIANGFATTRQEGIQLGQQLLDADLVHHVVDEHNFEDRELFYRFRQDDPPHLSPAGPSVASLKQDCSTKFGSAQKRGLLKWHQAFFALRPGDETLYEFRTDLHSTPTKKYPLKEATMKLDRSVKFCLLLTFADIQRSDLRLAFTSDEEQLTWLKAFEKSGAVTGQTEEEVEDRVKNAESIFEFSVKDIDKNEVSLEKYRGFVTLIVNFGKQEPDPEPVIKQFAAGYGVQFDMFSKINVNGANALPLYKYLKSRLKGTLGSFIKWNFGKFLCNRDGKPVKRYAPSVQPLDIAKDIEALF
ncbi:Glutathione peroxidase [Stylophora pistillata]|uniref:Glutathione peroxidase n=1 Tax=Stylophora pistillata TaxID=50429 RepID=A0A2B4SL37_STYPI|nr:Glutathione peroxidase [Stylophora pistillata]